jgi:hypothetical protein
MLSRRSLIGGSFGAAILAALGLGEEGLAKSRRARKSHSRKRRGENDQNRRHEERRQKNANRRDDRQRGHERRHPERAKDDGRDVASEGCLRNGKRCGGKKFRPCKKCCSGHARVSRRKKRTCACRPDGMTCEKPSQCCARICEQRVCGAFFS